ncbi:MAG: hypothetical protein JSU94_20825 [Phycisphaerales bacterium]|nr:MAG: hypothetical protein JSU94_20825 [Phycisphaerales bacterium]
MKGRNEDNFRELFERFMGSEEANRSAEDIRRGDELLGEHPAPGPSEELLQSIEATISVRLSHRRWYHLRQRPYRLGAVAAAIVVLVSFLARMEPGGKSSDLVYGSVIPAVLWESADIAAEDADLVAYTAEIEQIEEQIETLQSGEESGNGDSAISELEAELTNISGDFWKG